MTKIKKLRFGLYSSIGLLILVAVVSAGLRIRAWTSDSVAPKYLIEGDMIVNEAEQPIIEEEPFGALPSNIITNTLLSVNGDETYHFTGKFADATSTIVAIANPFRRATSSDDDIAIVGSAGDAFVQTGATSTVELVRLNITGVATSTYTINCGASPNYGAIGSTSISYNMLATGEIATSSFTGVIENNLSTSYGAEVDGGSVDKISLGASDPYFVCVIDTEDSAWKFQAFTDVGHTFEGYYSVRISKTRF